MCPVVCASVAPPVHRATCRGRKRAWHELQPRSPHHQAFARTLHARRALQLRSDGHTSGNHDYHFPLGRRQRPRRNDRDPRVRRRTPTQHSHFDELSVPIRTLHQRAQSKLRLSFCVSPTCARTQLTWTGDCLCSLTNLAEKYEPAGPRTPPPLPLGPP